MTIEGAILAGGKNSRYGGKNKAFIIVEGVKIIDRNLRVLRTRFSRISIITNNKEQFSDYSSYPMSSDYYHNIGPLAGIHSALRNAQSDFVFVTSCDMPFLDAAIITSIVDFVDVQTVDAIIPRINNKIEPLFALYNVAILDRLEQHITRDENRSIRSFLAKIDTRYIELEDNASTKRAFTNINKPEDLASLTS
jgi:molybdopterin-guanine dinucleotide biosynthesis protein A